MDKKLAPCLKSVEKALITREQKHAQSGKYKFKIISPIHISYFLITSICFKILDGLIIKFPLRFQLSQIKCINPNFQQNQTLAINT